MAPARSSAATTELRCSRGAACAQNASNEALTASLLEASVKQFASRTSLRGGKLSQYEKGLTCEAFAHLCELPPKCDQVQSHLHSLALVGSTQILLSLAQQLRVKPKLLPDLSLPRTADARLYRRAWGIQTNPSSLLRLLCGPSTGCHPHLLSTCTKRVPITYVIKGFDPSPMLVRPA